MSTSELSLVATGSKTNSTLASSRTNSDSSFTVDSQDDLPSRRQFVSRHRRELDRIKTDASLTRSHPVPHHTEDEQTRAGTNRCYVKVQRSCNNFYVSNSCSDWIETFLPFCRWLKVYEWKSAITKDLIAGVSVGVMIVPQSM